MASNGSYFLTLAILALVTFGTRAGGAYLMSWLTPTPRIERFLEGLAASVIAAMVASILATADVKTMIATFLAIAVAGLSRSTIWAMIAGMATAVCYPFVTSY